MLQNKESFRSSMATMSSSSHVSYARETSNYDEVSMQQGLVFSDCLKDLKNLRTQLYSAAEYFEHSFENDDQKQIVVQTLKDYAIKALVNTVDHLGSVTYKVNDLLNEKVAKISGTDLRVSCIEQRLQTCHEYIDREGFSQQSLILNTPKYHKRYVLQVTETMKGANGTKANYRDCSLDDEDHWYQLRNAVHATMRTPASSVGKWLSPSPSPQPSKRPVIFSFTKSMPKKELEKRSVSPHRFPLLRSESVTGRAPNSTRPAKDSIETRRYPSQPRKSMSMLVRTVGDSPKETDHYPSKSKRTLKSLLSRRKSKKDDMLFTYLDEY